MISFVFRHCICFLLFVTSEADCLSADRLHIHCHAVLLKLIFKLKLSDDIPIHLCGKREDAVVELVFFKNKMTPTELSRPGVVSTPSNKKLVPKRDSWWKVGFPFNTVAQHPQFPPSLQII